MTDPSDIDPSEAERTKRRPPNEWSSATQARIDAQRSLVAKLKPGSREHRLATDVLLLLQDSLHSITEARQVLDQARRLGKLSGGKS